MRTAVYKLRLLLPKLLIHSKSISRSMPVSFRNSRVVADGNYGAGVVAYRCRYYFYALDVQIVGGFVQNEHVRGVVGNHQAAEGKTHLFACTQFAARLVPHVVGKEITVEDGFHFMFRQVAVVEGFCLLEYAALITDEGVFLVQIDGGEVGTAPSLRRWGAVRP